MMPDSRNTLAASLHTNRRGRWHQRCVRITALLAVLVATVLPPLSLEVQFWIILAPVAVFGLSHGGADPFILRRLVAGRPRTLPLAIGLYLALSLVFLGLVWFVPPLALLVFLVLSIWHFGFTDAAYLSPSPNVLLMWLSGSLPILGPILGHPQQTAELFAWLVAYDTEPVKQVVSAARPLFATCWLAGFAVLVFRDSRKLGLRAPLELLLVGAALVSLPPLLAFAFYFCVVHSVRHFLSVAEFQPAQSRVKQMLGFLVRKSASATFIALGLALVVWAAMVIWDPASTLLVEAVRVMFWGLAALALPHGFVVKLWWDQQPAVQAEPRGADNSAPCE